MNLLEPDTLRRNLAWVLQIITATERLLSEAAAECDGDLQKYFLDHLEEEKDHAKWLAEDLEGFAIPLNGLAVAMAGAQFYLVKFVHPACLLGYMRALETPIPMPLLEELESAHGKKLLRTMRIHAELDPGHLEELNRQIALQPDDIRALIEMNAAQTSRQIAAYQG